MNIDPSKLLVGIPAGLRDELLTEYRTLATAYSHGQWKYASLDAGRFCEVAYSIAEGALSGTYPAVAAKPPRFPDACKALEKMTPVQLGDHSLRVLIPRVLVGMYDVRNNRNVGHIGGDVVANHMDATLAFANARWVLAEFVRIFHGTTTQDAQAAVEALVQRRVPVIWEIDGQKRVLVPTMSAADKVLLLLHGEAGWVPVKTLSDWAKYGNHSQLRTKVLGPLADAMLIELDETRDVAHISPLGIKRVESELIKPA
ncbi:MAG TPA: hypothetical protein VG797_05045 [Phycisphaerales bacterium]|nr:hypothetical protein [Phycisphaerales bacterium]